MDALLDVNTPERVRERVAAAAGAIVTTITADGSFWAWLRPSASYS